jgi:hypothetical protein
MVDHASYVETKEDKLGSKFRFITPLNILVNLSPVSTSTLVFVLRQGRWEQDIGSVLSIFI